MKWPSKDQRPCPHCLLCSLFFVPGEDCYRLRWELQLRRRWNQPAGTRSSYILSWEAMLGVRKRSSKFNRNPDWIILLHASMVEHVRDFCWQGLDASYMLSDVNYHIQKPYHLGLSSSTNEAIEVPKPSFVESVFDTYYPAGASGRRLLVRAELKSVSLMTHQLSKFFPHAETIVCFFMGIRPTAKACLLALRHFKFFWCKAKNFCPSKAMSFSLEGFARQVLNVDSSINEPEKVQVAAIRYVQWKSCAVESEWRDLWRAPRGLSVVWMFLHHIFFMLSQYFDDTDLAFHGKHLLCTLWSKYWMSRRNLFVVKPFYLISVVVIVIL